MREFADFETEFRRRDLLLVLLASRDYSCNESLLRTVLRGQGYLASGAQLRDDLFWLSERQLVRTRDVAGVLIATLLERGRDVAEGAESETGIARPEPGKS